MEVNPIKIAKKSEEGASDDVEITPLMTSSENPSESEELKGATQNEDQKAEITAVKNIDIGAEIHKETEASEGSTRSENEEEEYDPATAYKDDSVEVESTDGGQANANHTARSDDSDYEPEESTFKHESAAAVNQLTATTQAAPQAAPQVAPRPVRPNIPGLPPKPPVKAVRIGHSKMVPTESGSKAPINASKQLTLNEAMEAIMKSDVIKDPSFVKLSQAEQMKIIQEQLAKQGVVLPDQKPRSDAINASKYKNYDQVYSYNKPFKHVKDRIPLVPVNEFCRRPNISIPMTPQEEQKYESFLQTEMRYNAANNWEDFPDKLRLFVGNLPANTITKQDLFRIFSQYGDVIQIVIKAGFGFVQFRTSEACLECIKGETNVPLHNKIMRLDASRPQKSGVSSSPILSRGRERTTSEEMEEESESKRVKLENQNVTSVLDPAGEQNVGQRENQEDEEDDDEEEDEDDLEPECYIYITSDSLSAVVKKCNEVFSKSDIAFEFEDVSDQEIGEVISDAAYTGIIGACVIKDLKVNLQTFESTPDGGIKFDEYEGIEPEVAVDIMTKYKLRKKAAVAKSTEAEPATSRPAHSNSPAMAFNSKVASLPSLPAIPKKIHSPATTGATAAPNSFENQYSRNRNNRARNPRVGQHAPPAVPTNSYGSFNYANNKPFPQTLPSTPQVHSQPQVHNHPQPQTTQIFPYQAPAQANQPMQPAGYQNQGSTQSFTPQPGFGVPTYGAPPAPPVNHNPYGVPFGQNQPAGQPPMQQAANGSNDQLLTTLQNMDPSTMQSMISLLQQQQQQQQQQHQQLNIQQQPYQYQQALPYGNPQPNAKAYSPPNPNYAPPPQTQTQPPKSQLDSLLSQLQSNQSPAFPNSQSQTESLLESLQRLSGQR